ncbi:PadR family transcriptional regulator [Paenibacillus sp. FSL L8-0435]|uniref:PadR family transcriptional regulator n=1 Tax=Paenibacillus TaxID=44249 RepID=UPI001C8CFE06|nr:PadR family transcriptional regulator [Paenibacillus xylanexedens]MBY0118612.1 PadR family transcriptional regulator [Paenibacillus xylanexedens]
MANRSGRANTKFAVLGILALGPHTGYDIKQHMDQSTSYFWNENYGQIYPSLAELLDNSDINLEVIRQDGKPDKKLYRITDQGRETLSQWLSQPKDYVVDLKKNELLLRVFFGSNGSSEKIIMHIEAYQRKLEENLKVFEELEKWLLNMEHKDNNYKYWMITNQYGKNHFTSLIQWCKDSIIILKS